MSVESEITRLKNAKNDIKTAIENRGVTVASNLSIADYPQLIGDIVSTVESTIAKNTIAKNTITAWSKTLTTTRRVKMLVRYLVGNPDARRTIYNNIKITGFTK